MDGPVLLTGASGLLGSWLRRTAPAEVDLVPVSRRAELPGGLRADLRDPTAAESIVRRVRPALVIHAAYALDESSIVDATAHLAAAAEGESAPVVLVSTDAVFSGDARPRAEDDEPDPVADYGRWKAEAERSVLAGTPGSAVVRLPLIVSLDPLDHVAARIASAASAGKSTPWFSDELRQPAAAEDLARALWRIVDRDAEGRCGTWHLPGPERLSRFQIAERYVATLGIAPEAITGSPTPAGLARPRDLHLTADRARTAIGWSPAPILT